MSLPLSLKVDCTCDRLYCSKTLKCYINTLVCSTDRYFTWEYLTCTVLEARRNFVSYSFKYSCNFEMRYFDQPKLGFNRRCLMTSIPALQFQINEAFLDILSYWRTFNPSRWTKQNWTILMRKHFKNVENKMKKQNFHVFTNKPVKNNRLF